jgi:hypothetical protein
VIDESDLQNKKQFDSRISTFIGIKIDSSDEFENANDSIRVKSEFDSTIIDLSGAWTLLLSHSSVGRGQFRKIIEFGIQTPTISVSLIVQCGTGLIEPLRTTIRRSYNCVESESSGFCRDPREREEERD